MSTLTVDLALPGIEAVEILKEARRLSRCDGRILEVPIAWYPRHDAAKRAQLKPVGITPYGYGIHWPDLHEDLSVHGFL
jgi:hypothetical protein